MREIEAYSLAGEDIVHYFLSVLMQSEKEVPSELEAMLSMGRFFVLAPQGMDEIRLKQLRMGGVVPSGPRVRIGEHILTKTGNLADALANTILKKYLGRDCVVFIREPYLKLSDKSDIVKELSPVDSELFKIMKMDDLNESVLGEAIRRFTVVWSFLLMVSKPSPKEDHIADLISAASLIAVGAYDGESYLFWCRQE
jgi:hypothetical protein